MWLHNGALNPSHISYSWKIILSIEHWLFCNLRWVVGSGSTPTIALDSLSGLIGLHTLSPNLIIYLNNMGLFVIIFLANATLETPFYTHWKEVTL